MEHLNVEIKARSQKPDEIRNLLKSKGADFRGIDHQIDTYFKVRIGMLKLREGTLENHLIFYERERQKGPKASRVILLENKPGSPLKEIPLKSLGVLRVVDKQREIYFIDNVKFHIDSIKNLGTFLEIEAIDRDGSIGKGKLPEQFDHYMKLFQIKSEDLIGGSYCDLLNDMEGL